MGTDGGTKKLFTGFGLASFNKSCFTFKSGLRFSRKRVQSGFWFRVRFKFMLIWLTGSLGSINVLVSSISSKGLIGPKKAHLAQKVNKYRRFNRLKHKTQAKAPGLLMSSFLVSARSSEPDDIFSVSFQF